MKNSKDRLRRRFLVISSTGIGDTLMGTPALRALKNSFPESEIHVLVNRRKRALLTKNPYVDRILGYRNNPLFRLLLRLRTLPFFYDHVLVFHANEDLWDILKRVRYGDCYNRQDYYDPSRRTFLLDGLPRHSIQKRMALVEKVGGRDSGDYRYDFLLPSSDQQWAERQMAKWGVSHDDRLVGMQLGAADDFKCWPVEFYVEVARALRERYGVKIYLNASPAEKPLVRDFLERMGPGGVLTHFSNNLSRSAALIQACSLFLSPDTGPMHLAAGLGVPTIALFCPTEARVTGPLGGEKVVIIQKEKPCVPCRSRHCRDNFCMRQISPEEICLRAAEWLSRSEIPKGGDLP